MIKKNNGWGEETDYLYDIQMARLDKMVTEVAYVSFTEAEDQRAGGGTQQKALTNDTAEKKQSSVCDERASIKELPSR